ncbi:PAS domain-containing sensor histidine kinase [Pedobacter sp. SYSU D00535]|uniref:PAS domain-containing sensor histidine kinase n=1 Tax=Pedobacter sp. SYSU D00535 TaxID=2810308 RepID=UPI001A95EC3C|nr:PAS domain-containing sensor histidine kinase [Pedobacter sp. SYSU D00535]
MSFSVDKKLLDTLIDTEELYQNAPCGYLSFLPDGTIIKINRTLLEWLGYELEEVLYKKKFTDLISKGAALHYEMFFRPLINANGAVNQLSYDIIKKNNASFPVFLSAVPSKAVDGVAQAINATLYDVSERKLYERELLISKRKAEAERKRFEFLSDFNPDIIWTADVSGKVDYVNKRFFQFFNISEFLAKEVLLKVCIKDRFKLLRCWNTGMKSLEEFKVEIRLENHAQAFEWYLIKAQPYFEDGRPVKWIGSCTNIDSQVKSIQRRDEFINIASHELKTPITSLKAYHQILQRMALPESSRKFLLRADASLNSLEFLVSSLFDVSNIDSGQLSLNLSSFSITKVLEECIDLISATQNSHTIIRTFNSDDVHLVYADRQKIMQVIINLINNAIKYSPQADKVEVGLKLSENGKLVKIEISDFGVGIPADKLELIFEKYYRVSDTTNNNKASGLGLGLYIIQSILKQHQSRVFVNSTLNEGSCFYFSLPVSNWNNSEPLS